MTLSIERKAELYDHMLAVAQANGFESIGDAISKANRLRNDLAASKQDAMTAWDRHAMANRISTQLQNDLVRTAELVRFRSRVADLVHLMQFASITTPSLGDSGQIAAALNDLRKMLTEFKGNCAPITGNHTEAHGADGED